MIPVLYLQSTSEIGGSDVTLLRTVEALDRTRVEPHVVLPHDGPLVESFRKAGCGVHLLPAMRKLTRQQGIAYLGRYVAGYVPGALAISRLIRREGIALVHTNSIHNLYGFLAARWAGRPHIWHVREIVVQSRAVRWLEVRLVRRFSTRFVVVSDAVGEMFRGRDGRAPSHMIKLYDGVDLDSFHPRQRADNRIRRELGLGDTVPLLGIVTRLDPVKGVDVFLEAASLVRRAVPEARFLVCGGEIAGHEGYEASLRRRAETLGLAQAVLFSGWRYSPRDIPEVYGALDVSVQCPANPEPYGLANVEAMASGVPGVAAAAGGPLELCVQGETTLLVPPRDPRATAEAAIALLREPVRRAAMGAAGRRRAERLFDRRRCVRALEDLYATVVG
ncbi:MAG TPA: glycosyltransferase [Methylomirabilota bacterium]|nr:glycosyltransferase [Methylomirabilota bacterium]